MEGVSDDDIKDESVEKTVIEQFEDIKDVNDIERSEDKLIADTDISDLID